MTLAKINVLVVALFLTMFVSNVFAIPMTFTHEGYGSGTLNGDSFESVAFTITAFADTENRDVYSHGFFLDHTSASISLSGLGNFSFITATRTFVNNSFSLVGFSRAGISGTDLFNGPFNTSFSTWDMLSEIGPITGDGGLSQWTSSNVLTDGGILTFDDDSSSATFMATTTAPVPEPSTWVLMGTGLAGLAWYRRRKSS